MPAAPPITPAVPPRALLRAGRLACAAFALLLVAVGCATPPAVESRGLVPDWRRQVLDAGPFELTVQADLPVQAAMLREFALQDLPGVLPLSEHRSGHAASVELLLSTTPEAINYGAADAFAFGHSHRRYDRGYYHGHYYSQTEYHQVSDLVFTIRDAGGRRLYSAHHRGYGDTVAEAGRSSLRIIIRQLQHDLIPPPEH